MKVRAYSSEQYNALDDEMKETITEITKALRSVKDSPMMFKRTVAAVIDKVYNIGLAAGLNGDVVEVGRCVNIDRGQKYQITCPYCGETYDLDMEAMLKCEQELNELNQQNSVIV